MSEATAADPAELVQLAARSTRTVRGSVLAARDIPALARARGHSWAALADRGFIAGVPAFLAACRHQGVAPVVGLEHDDRYYFARTDEGLRILTRLSSTICCRQQLAPPESTDVIVVACRTDNEDQQVDAIGIRRDHTEPDHNENRLLAHADSQGIPAIGLAPYAAASSDQRKSVAILTAAAARSTLEHELTRTPASIHMATAAELTERFANRPELLANSTRLARECRAGSAPGGTQPAFARPGSDAATDIAELRQAAATGLSHKWPDGVPEQYEQQLALELDVIEQAGFAALFLVVADILRSARDRGIETGPGRGSAAGSLVSWSLDITRPDPLAHSLQFSRFLNLHRVSPPDFDIDVEPAAHARIQAELRQRWNGDGEPRAAQIAAWATLKHAGAFRLAAQVQGIPPKQVNKAIDALRQDGTGAWREFGQQDGDTGTSDPEQPIEPARTVGPDGFRGFNQLDKSKLLGIVEDVDTLHGASNALSRHPGAIALLPEPIGGNLPLFLPENVEDDADPIIQIDHHEAEDAGAVKVDVLAIASLRITGSIRRQCADSDPWNLPEDGRVYDMIAQGDTVGLFQIEGAGITRAARELAPRNFNDLRALIALYRPGPLAYLDSYAQRAAGKERPVPPHPALTDSLAETHGIVVYQEQAMQAAVEIAAFTPWQADEMRRAIGKKIPAEMARLKSLFITGAHSHSGLAESEAEQIWSILERQAGYAFNRAHATAYAMITYATAFYAYHYPGAFYAALIEATLLRPTGDHTDRIQVIAATAARKGIRIARPDVLATARYQRAQASSDSTGEAVIYPPLHIIKGVGASTNEAVCRIGRHTALPQTLGDWVAALERARVPTAQIETLTTSGAFRNVAVNGTIAQASLLDDEADHRPCDANDLDWADMAPYPADIDALRVRGDLRSLDPGQWPTDQQEGDTMAVLMRVSRRRSAHGPYTVVQLGDPSRIIEAFAARALHERLEKEPMLPGVVIATLKRGKGGKRAECVDLRSLAESEPLWPRALCLHMPDIEGAPPVERLQKTLRQAGPGSYKAMCVTGARQDTMYQLEVRIAPHPDLEAALRQVWPQTRVRLYKLRHEERAQPASDAGDGLTAGPRGQRQGA